MELPLISCVVPVFNGELYLAEALDSVIAQVYERVEIIVVDDGSTDGTALLAGAYKKRIRYCRRDNGGEAAARNTGIEAARGEFIAFLDADDLWHPDKLARQINRFRERSEIDFCFTFFQNFWIPELVDEERRYQGSPLARIQSGWSTSTLLTRRSTFAKFGNFSDDVKQTSGSESMIWFLRAAAVGAVVDVMPEVLMYRRMHASNASRKSPVDTFFPILKKWRDYRRQQPKGSEDSSQ